MNWRGKKLVELALKKSIPSKETVEDKKNYVKHHDEVQLSICENLTSQKIDNQTISSEICINNDAYKPSTSGNSKYVPPNLFERYDDSSCDDSIDDPTYSLPNEINCDSSDNEQSVNINNFTNVDNENITVSENIEKKNTRKARNIRKHNRNTGKAHVTLKGKAKTARELKPLSNCRAKCRERISETNRQTIFKEYWSLGSYDKRAAFVATMMSITATKNHRPRTTDINKTKSRTKTYEYHLQVEGVNVKLCMQCFLKTLGESQNMTKLVAKKKQAVVSGLINSDKRGKRIPVNKHSIEKLESVKSHILSFPSYQSHYTRRTNDKKYLSSDLTLQKMYELYKENVQNHVSLTIYKNEFHKLNLSFKKRQQDTCYSCDKFNMQIKMADNEVKRKEIETLRNAHQSAADLAYEKKRADKKEAAENEEMQSFSFDLQQCLPTPALSSSVAFYKRQLWTFNLTIYNNTSGKSDHFLWNESISGRGANQIASCLYKYIRKLPQNVKHIVLYSDTCGGQNRNSHIAAMFSLLLQEKFTNIKIIDHKFMISGHSHMEVDVAHGIIEKKKKKTNIEIYHPHDWSQLIRSSSENFNVIEMCASDFLDFSALLKSKGPLVLRKKNATGDLYKWHDVQWLRYSEDKLFGEILYKKSLETNEDFQVLSLIRRGLFKNIKVHPITDKPIPISMEKKKDLLSLLDLIPGVFHNYYKNLPEIKKNCIDPDLEEEDFDE